MRLQVLQAQQWLAHHLLGDKEEWIGQQERLQQKRVQKRLQQKRLQKLQQKRLQKRIHQKRLQQKQRHASTLPARPMEVGSRVKAAAPPPVPPPASADSRSGEYDYRNGESSRQRQWRLHGVWRKRAGKHVDWYNEQYRK